MASVKPMRKVANKITLTSENIKEIARLLQSGGSEHIKSPMSSIKLDKIVIDQSGPSDNPNALGFVSNQSDDIHIVLPEVNKAINSRIQNLDIQSMTWQEVQSAKDEVRKEVAKNILTIMSEAFGHEESHLSGKDTSGNLGSESAAKSKGEEVARNTINAASVKSELQKLASKLSDLGEDSFVGDVLLISSMIKEEVVSELPKKLSSRDLDTLVKDMDRLFTK